MSFAEARFGGAVVLTVAGRIDLTNADAFKEALTAALGAAASTVVERPLLTGVQVVLQRRPFRRCR